jgi:FkbM family methyltransferase
MNYEYKELFCIIYNMFLIKEGSKDKSDDTFIEFKINESEAQPKFTYFHLDKETAEWIHKNDVTERALIYWAIENFARSDKNFVDIGAHLGIYSWNFAKHSNHVYSFECSPKTFCYLAANIALHNVTDKVTLFNNALGNKEQIMDYIIRSNEGGESGFKIKNDDDTNCKKIPIKVMTLDSYNIENIGLIKIDVEGFEKEVLEGSLKTLQNNNYPPIIFESWSETRNYIKNVKELKIELFTLIQSLGYKIYEINGGYGEIFLAAKN